MSNIKQLFVEPEGNELPFDDNFIYPYMSDETMKLSTMFDSKYFNQEHVKTGPINLTIKLTVAEMVKDGSGASKEMVVVYFYEDQKGLVLNKTNYLSLNSFCQTHTDDTSDWDNLKIQLYFDPTVTNGAKIVGGVRLREPQVMQQAPQGQPVQGTQQATFNPAEDFPE